MISNTCINTLSFQKWFIGNDIREILLANSDITAIVGTDIFPLIAPEGTEGEFILYSRIKYSKEMNKIGIVSDICRVQITAISDNYDTAVNLASLIDNTLVGSHTNSDGNTFAVKLVDSTEDYTDNKYVEILEFEIK